VIKIEGLDQKSECEYGKQISILLENKTDQWEKVILDGKEQKLEHHKITWKELAPGKHVLHLKAVDQKIKLIKGSHLRSQKSFQKQ